jgi:uncharacterized protein (UPF0332 family)
MSFIWADFLTLAASLQQNPTIPGPEEASLRTAISRAYYAAFRSARDLAQAKEGFLPSGTGQYHGRVQQHFRNQTDHIHRKIGADLGRLCDNRRKADYEGAVRRLPSVAQLSVQMAGAILNRLGSI